MGCFDSRSDDNFVIRNPASNQSFYHGKLSLWRDWAGGVKTTNNGRLFLSHSTTGVKQAILVLWTDWSTLIGREHFVPFAVLLWHDRGAFMP